jgi:hypothetical protein
MTGRYPEIRGSVSHEEIPPTLPYEVRAFWADGVPGNSLATFTAQGEAAAIAYAVELLTSGFNGRLAAKVKIKEVHGWPWYWVGADRVITRAEVGESYI